MGEVVLLAGGLLAAEYRTSAQPFGLYYYCKAASTYIQSFMPAFWPEPTLEPAPVLFFSLLVSLGEFSGKGWCPISLPSDELMPRSCSSRHDGLHGKQTSTEWVDGFGSAYD